MKIKVKRGTRKRLFTKVDEFLKSIGFHQYEPYKWCIGVFSPTKDYKCALCKRTIPKETRFTMVFIRIRGSRFKGKKFVPVCLKCTGIEVNELEESM